MWPEHAQTVYAWMAVSDQWRLGPMGIALGLDWPAVDVLLKALDIPLAAGLLAGLRTMEGEVLDVWAQERLARRTSADPSL